MTTTPKLGLTLMAANMAQKEVVFNQAILAFDALFAGTVLSAALTAPPGSPSLGDAYVVAASPTGLWAGKADYVAFYYNGWQFYTPPLQLELYDVATSSFIRYEGSSLHWVSVPGSTVSVLADLTDVSGTGAATNGQVLTWNSSASKWEPATLSFASTLATMTDVNVTEGSGINGYYLTYNNSTSKWVATALPTQHTTVLGLTDVTIPGGVADGYVCVYNATGPGVKFVAQSTIVTTATVASLSNVGDVSYSGLTTGDTLIWNGTVWGPSSSTATYSFAGMTDGPGTMTGHANQFLVVNSLETALTYESLATILAATVIDLQHLSDVPGSIGSPGQVLAVNTGATGFVYTTPSNALEIDNNGTSVDAAATKINFVNASSITTSAHDVTVTLPVYTPVVFKDHGTAVSTAATAVDFEGAGVTVTESGSTVTVTIAATTTALASLTDVNISSPADKDLLAYNTATSKWKNFTLASVLGAVTNTAYPALYELGAFAPPTTAMFPNSYQASSLNFTSIANRGLIMQPAAYGSGSYAVVRYRTLVANTAPWVITTRVSANSYESAGHGAGICLFRSADNAMVYLALGNDGVSGEPYTVRFGSFSSGGVTETVLTTANVEAHWLQLSFDGTYVRARISSDGVMWNNFGTAQNASVVLGGVPDCVGLFQRLVATTAGDAGGLYTYYDDPDYPATSHTIQGVVNLGMDALTNSQFGTLGSGVDGYVVYWNNTDGKFELKASGSGSLVTLSDVSITTGSGVDGYVVYWNDGAGKFELKAEISGSGPSYLGINTQTASYTLVLADVGKLIDMNDASANTVTVPPNSSVAVPIGDVITVRQRGAGATTIAAGAGVTLNALSGTLLLAGQYSVAELTKVATDVWEVVLSGSAVGGGSSTLAGDSDVSITSPASNNVLAYNGSAWANETLTALIDAAFGNTQGDILYRGSATWGVLAPGTSGYVLTSGGTGANPSWAAGGGGGSSTLAADTDVTITSPTNNQVLTYDSTSSKWVNATPSGGGSVLLPPEYEHGPFAPSQSSWFVTTDSYSGITVTLSDTANRGMSIAANGATANDQIATMLRDASAWGSTWSVTARIVNSNLIGNYPFVGLGILDTSGKITFIGAFSQGGAGVACQRYSSNSSYAGGDVISQATAGRYDWFRIRLTGGNLFYGVSNDGLNWMEVETTVGAYLGTISKVGIVSSPYTGIGSAQEQTLALCTYYDDPDYPATGHTTTTSAVLDNLSDVSVSSPVKGQGLIYNGTDWVNVVPLADGWGKITFGTTASIFGDSGVHVSDQTFTLAAGEMLQIEGFVYKNSGNNGLLGISEDGSNGYVIYNGTSGSTAINYYNGSYNGMTSSGSCNWTGTHEISISACAIGSSDNAVFGKVDGNPIPPSTDVNINLIGAITVYLLTDDITKCAFKARIVSSGMYG